MQGQSRLKVLENHLTVGIVSHEKNIHDSHNLPAVLNHIEQSRGKTVKPAVVDRGYRGKKVVNGTEIILPKKALKKRKQWRRRAALPHLSKETLCPDEVGRSCVRVRSHCGC